MKRRFSGPIWSATPRHHKYEMFLAFSGLVFSTKQVQNCRRESLRCKNVPNAANSLIRCPRQVTFARIVRMRYVMTSDFLPCSAAHGKGGKSTHGGWL